jgi:hypothetical protein
MKTMKGVLTFAVIAVVTAAVALAISGPPRSAKEPAPAPRTSATGVVAAGVDGTALNNAPTIYLPPSYGRSFRSGCSGGGCCPK